MTETNFIQRVHRQLPKELYRWKIKDDYAGGVPDAWYRGDRASLFVEYKYVPKLPKRETTLVRATLSELQVMWLHERQKQGENCLVIVGVPTGGVVFDNIKQAHKGIPMSDFQSRILPIKDIARVLCDHCIR